MSPYPNRKSADVVREVLPLRGARVLDVGCGDGSLVRLMTKEGAAAIGLEISDRQLARARAETPVGDESYRVGRAETLPFEDHAFDIVAFYNSLHHVPVDSQDEALAESARVLASGGHLFVVEPLAEGPMFELMRPVDDETEVRAAALAARPRVPRSRRSGSTAFRGSTGMSLSRPSSRPSSRSIPRGARGSRRTSPDCAKASNGRRGETATATALPTRTA
jgi:SAM-dependent methyltransferase